MSSLLLLLLLLILLLSMMSLSVVESTTSRCFIDKILAARSKPLRRSHLVMGLRAVCQGCKWKIFSNTDKFKQLFTEDALAMIMTVGLFLLLATFDTLKRLCSS